MNAERIAELRAAFGLGDREARSRPVQVLLSRLAEAEQQAARAGSDLADLAQAGVDGVGARNVWSSVDGAPLHAGTELAARYDYALVRLAERQAALILVAEALKEGR